MWEGENSRHAASKRNYSRVANLLIVCFSCQTRSRSGQHWGALRLLQHVPLSLSCWKIVWKLQHLQQLLKRLNCWQKSLPRGAGTDWGNIWSQLQGISSCHCHSSCSCNWSCSCHGGVVGVGVTVLVGVLVLISCCSRFGYYYCYYYYW